jgi:alpha-N-arabinofuranosidase
MKILASLPILIICIAPLLRSEPATNVGIPTGDPTPAPLRLQIDPKGPVKTFAPTFAGIMTEEINHSYDGGLYGELIRNRIFRDNETNAEGWTLTVPSNAAASMILTERHPLTDRLPRSLEIRIEKASSKAPILVANSGFWGIPVNPGTTYRVSLYAKGNNLWDDKREGGQRKKGDSEESAPVLFRAPLTLSLESNDGAKVYASASTPPLTGNWQKIDLTLRTPVEITSSKENKFVISASAPGTFRLNLVSLFPPTYKDRSNGNRVDLMEKIAALQPKFLRFPGGNFVEGNNLSDFYNWKQTRGPLEFRSGHNGCWGYRSSDGLGLLEFMGWCEDLGMQPILAVYAGYSLNQQSIPPGSLLQPYVQDAMDEVEYLTGDAKSTYWGAIRAKDGHPEPFRLKYIEIGNEDQWDRSKSYDGRYAQFHDAMKARYPELQLIATMPVKSRKPDLLDDHYYNSSEWYVTKGFKHYDSTDRNGPKIFVGEWATRYSGASGATPNLHEALGDAAWMCAMERNADIILMQCYAPLLTNENPGGSQWKPNLIGYDALHSYVSPSWHAQQLFNTHRGDEVLTAFWEKEDNAHPIPYSVTRDKAKGLLHIKLVNLSTAPREVTIDPGKETAVESKASLITLTSKDPAAVNSLESPDAVKPVSGMIRGTSVGFPVTVPSNALVIVTLKLK